MSMSKTQSKKSSQFFTTRVEVEDWLYEQGIDNYEINEDLLVHVTGNVMIDTSDLEALPVQFGSIDGDFSLCSFMSQPNDGILKSLLGCPRTVKGQFSCLGNQIESLVGGPKEVKQNYDCANNELKNLTGGPLEVGQDFLAEKNQIGQIGNFKGMVGRDLNLGYNNLLSLNGLKAIVGGNLVVHTNRLKTLKHLHECAVGGKVLAQLNPRLTADAAAYASEESAKSLIFNGSELIDKLKIIAEKTKLDKNINLKEKSQRDKSDTSQNFKI